MGPRDLPGLDLSDGSDPWALPEAPPTRLVALWPGDAPPMATEVVAALGAQLGRELDAEDYDGEDGPETLWCIVVDVAALGAQRPHEALLWCEPVDEPVDDLGEAAAACRWVIGLESPLDPAEPLGSLHHLVRLLTGAFEEIPALLDVDAERWYPRPALEELFGSDADPPPTVLWIIHMVTDDSGSGGVWVHTHGLWRCGLPELEMLEVPGELSRAAAELLNTVGGRMLESMLPAPGEPLPVGPDLDVTVVPWQAVAPFVSGPGGPVDRTGDEEDNPHVGLRAVVCGVERLGTYKKIWQAPCEALARIAHGEATVFLSARETERQARLARRGWPQLAVAFNGLGPHRVRIDSIPTGPEDGPAARFLLKAGLTAGGSGGEREHLWFVVRRFEPERAEVELLNQPMFVRALSRGDVTWIGRDVVSDWSVVTPEGTYGPGEVAAMTRAIELLAAPGSGQSPPELPA